MLSERLISEVRQLGRGEKMRLVQILVNELALEEAMPQDFVLAEQYEAANILQEVLDEYKRQNY